MLSADLPHRVGLNVGIGDMGVRIGIPITPLATAWNNLRDRNALSRANDRLRVDVIHYIPRESCPCCGAHPVHLQLVEVNQHCRKCGSTHEFCG